MKGMGGRSRKLGVWGTEGVQQGRKSVGRASGNDEEEKLGTDELGCAYLGLLFAILCWAPHFCHLLTCPGAHLGLRIPVCLQHESAQGVCGLYPDTQDVAPAIHLPLKPASRSFGTHPTTCSTSAKA